MIITVLDTETTGLKTEKADRVIEIALVGFSIDIVKQEEIPKEVFRIERRFNPHRSIDPIAQMIHGISQADLVGKPEFKECESLITKVFDKSDLIVAHNLTFDAGFIFNEYSLIGKALPDVQGFCTMSEGRWATSTGKNPNLRELCYCLDVEYNPDEAHAALYDVLKTAECFFRGVKLGGYNIKELFK